LHATLGRSYHLDYAEVSVTLQPVLGRQSGVGGRSWPDTGSTIKSYMGCLCFIFLCVIFYETA